MKRQTDKKDGVFYLLDCFCGSIGQELLTGPELAWRVLGQRRDLTEEEIKSIAADHEAELHRYTFRDGEQVEHVRLTEVLY